tara:strand:+ start:459 stop:671 length:213 start_codon:yes stop_codon:yes gene_type:complete
MTARRSPAPRDVQISVRLRSSSERHVVVDAENGNGGAELPLARIDLEPAGTSGFYRLTLSEELAASKGLL